MPTEDPFPNLSEEELLKEFRASGNVDYLGAYFLRKKGLLFKIALDELKNAALAEDVVQDTYVKFQTKFGTIKESVDGWLRWTVKNACTDLKRREWMQCRLLPDVTHHLFNVLPKLKSFLPSKEQKEVARKCYDKIEARHKKCVDLLIEGLTFDEIVEKTGLGRKTVGEYLHEAAEELRRALYGS